MEGLTMVRQSILAFAGATLLGVSTAADAAIIDIVALSDGYVVLLNGQPTSPATLQNTNLSQNLVAGQEVRSVYEFDLPVLTDPIISATFLGSVVQNSAAPGTLTFFGYSGNGTIEGSDATQLATSMGSIVFPTQVPTGTSIPFEVPLSAAFINGLGSGFLGLTTTAASGDTILVSSLEGAVDIRPRLRLETEEQPTTGQPPVPEPGTMLLFASGLAGVVARWRKARAAGTE